MEERKEAFGNFLPKKHEGKNDSTFGGKLGDGSMGEESSRNGNEMNFITRNFGREFYNANSREI